MNITRQKLVDFKYLSTHEHTAVFLAGSLSLSKVGGFNFLKEVLVIHQASTSYNSFRFCEL